MSRQADNAEAASRVRAARAFRKLTQAQLAAKLGVSLATMKRIEDGQRPMSTDDLLNVAEACDFPTAFMLGGLEAFDSAPDIDAVLHRLAELERRFSLLEHRERPKPESNTAKPSAL